MVSGRRALSADGLSVHPTRILSSNRCGNSAMSRDISCVELGTVPSVAQNHVAPELLITVSDGAS